MTQTAEEAAKTGHGICYAKANLLACLLRKKGIPTGYCCQKLILREEEPVKFCIHALNAVFFEGHWLRLDARGGKGEATLDFISGTLAFHADPDAGEMDYPTVYANPNAKTMETLERGIDAFVMYQNDLPENL